KIRAEKINQYMLENDELLSEDLTTFNRVINLTNKATSTEVKRDLLVEEEEIERFDTFNRIEESDSEYVNKKAYDKALEQFLTLKERDDKFFEHVMVMVANEQIRENRLSPLAKISEKMLTICDLSKPVR